MFQYIWKEQTDFYPSIVWKKRESIVCCESGMLLPSNIRVFPHPPSSVRSAQRDIYETSFPAIFLRPPRTTRAFEGGRKRVARGRCSIEKLVKEGKCPMQYQIRMRERDDKVQGREKERESTSSGKWPKLGPVAIISLAGSRQMSEHFETHRLSGRFLSTKITTSLPDNLCSFITQFSS